MQEKLDTLNLLFGNSIININDVFEDTCLENNITAIANTSINPFKPISEYNSEEDSICI